jgi:hypothetical protein
MRGGFLACVMTHSSVILYVVVHSIIGSRVSRAQFSYLTKEMKVVRKPAGVVIELRMNGA